MNLLIILIGILILFIIINFTLLIQIAKQIPEIYNQIYTSNALGVGEGISEINIADFMTYNGKSSEVKSTILLIGNVNCEACKTILNQMKTKTFRNDVDIKLLYPNDQKLIKTYKKEYDIPFSINSINDEVLSRLKTPVSPFLYIVDEHQVVKKTSAVYSIKKFKKLMDEYLIDD